LTVPVAVDTNVLIELLAGSPDLARRAREVLDAASARGVIVVSPVVYAELLAYPGRGAEDVTEFLAATRIVIQWEIPPAVWQKAGTAYASYVIRRRASGSERPRRILADFLIGAQAEAAGELLTRDVDFYRVNFPDLPWSPEDGVGGQAEAKLRQRSARLETPYVHLAGAGPVPCDVRASVLPSGKQGWLPGATQAAGESRPGPGAARDR
jgi:predicted nucleic acid-binding protein